MPRSKPEVAMVSTLAVDPTQRLRQPPTEDKLHVRMYIYIYTQYMYVSNIYHVVKNTYIYIYVSFIFIYVLKYQIYSCIYILGVDG